MLDSKKYALIGSLFISFLISACNRNVSNMVPVGGYCGVSTEPFENPYDNQNIDTEIFTVLTNLPNQKYQADNISILFKKEEVVTAMPSTSSSTYTPDEQMMFLHRPVLTADGVSASTFKKSCARGLTQDSTGLFDGVVIPSEVTLKDDGTWTASKAVSYVVKYGQEFMAEGFLVGEAENVDPAPANSLDYNFLDTVFLLQTGELNRAQKKLQANADTQLDEIFMQVQVSAAPPIFARIALKKVAEPEPTNSTTAPSAKQ